MFPPRDRAPSEGTVTMQAFICTTCGTQFAPSAEAPTACPICEDERQFVPYAGQSWTTSPRLMRTHMNAFRDEHGLLGIGISPQFAIGQRALLVPAGKSHILWDCISLVDRSTVEIIRALGGLSAIAISHPHYYTSMIDWSDAFGGIPIYLHAADKPWVFRQSPALRFWEGDTLEIADGLTLIRCGGHYSGGTVLHRAQGGGAILTGDILQVVADRKHIGFMRSYPNFIPLGPAAVEDIAARVEPWSFDSIYGAFWNYVIASDAKQALRRSVERHLHWCGTSQP